MKRGFQRVRIDGEFYEIPDAPALDKKFKHNIDVVVDRIVVSGDMQARLAESFETALQLAEGISIAEIVANEGENTQMVFSEKFACPVSGFTIAEIEPRLFSFNNPFGACPKCDGLGAEAKVSEDLVVPDEKLSLKKGAIAPWSRTSAPYYTQTLKAVCNAYGASMDTPWQELSDDVRHAVLHGTGGKKIEFVYDDGLRSYKTQKAFEGVVGNLTRRYRETESAGMREEIEKYMSSASCDSCGGYRLKPEALAVKIDGNHIGEISQKSIREAHIWFEGISAKLTDTQKEIGERILKEIRDRLTFLVDVGT